MISINPQKLTGKWVEGFALDIHTISSIPTGYTSSGHIAFDTKRSEMGDLLYKLKYQTDKSVLDNLLEVVVDYVDNKWRIAQTLDLIVPIPPSDTSRKYQPVLEVAKGIGSRIGVQVSEKALIKTKATPQLKDIDDYKKRLEALSGVFACQAEILRGKTVLLFDDLYRSGATANAAALLLREQGKVAKLYLLTLTRTRSKF